MDRLCPPPPPSSVAIAQGVLRLPQGLPAGGQERRRPDNAGRIACGEDWRLVLAGDYLNDHGAAKNKTSPCNSAHAAIYDSVTTRHTAAAFFCAPRGSFFSSFLLKRFVDAPHSGFFFFLFLLKCVVKKFIPTHAW